MLPNTLVPVPFVKRLIQLHPPYDSPITPSLRKRPRVTQHHHRDTTPVEWRDTSLCDVTPSVQVALELSCGRDTHDTDSVLSSFHSFVYFFTAFQPSHLPAIPSHIHPTVHKREQDHFYRTVSREDPKKVPPRYDTALVCCAIFQAADRTKPVQVTSMLMLVLVGVCV